MTLRRLRQRVQLVDSISKSMKRADLAPVILNEASHEIPEQFLDCAKARAWLDWKPRRTLEQGLAETIAWYRQALA